MVDKQPLAEHFEVAGLSLVAKAVLAYFEIINSIYQVYCYTENIEDAASSISAVTKEVNPATHRRFID